MEENPQEWMRAIEQTFVVRNPKQQLATFGSTTISYYVVTEPIYQELAPGEEEGVIRTGKVVAARPAVVTPTYALNLQGFSPEAYEYIRHLAREYGPGSPGILYQYSNEAHKVEIVKGKPSEIANRISGDLESRQENLSVVMVGVDELWDIALLKFMYEFTSSSAKQNVRELQGQGLLDAQPHLGGVPRAAAHQIERLFIKVEQGADPELLKRELDRWGIFGYYEARFLNLFRKHL